jgi:oligopeptide/dipeptide ABC transporter ATP-binding protein
MAASALAGRVRTTSERLVVDNLTVELTHRHVPLVQNVSFGVERGEILAIIGESGSGKTMTCRAIVGALPNGIEISGGEVRIGEIILRRANGRPTRTRTPPVAMVFADPHASLDPLQRVGPQIAEVARVHQHLGRRQSRETALGLLQQVLMPAPERTYRLFPFEVSGGMAQRAMIACGLAARPHFILADEPTSALDATIQLEILDLLSALARDSEVGMVITTHDIAVAARIATTICVVYAGKVVEMGPAQAVLRAPEHPYTRLLLRARPRGTRAHRLTAIPGEPPSPGEVPSGCPFAPRCPHVGEICWESEPQLAEQRSGGAAACHFAGQLTEAIL